MNRLVRGIRHRIEGFRYKRQLQSQIGCIACKHYFTFYKHDSLCACHALEIIDYFDGFYINSAGAECDSFKFNGDYELLGWLDLEEEIE